MVLEDLFFSKAKSIEAKGHLLGLEKTEILLWLYITLYCSLMHEPISLWVINIFGALFQVIGSTMLNTWWVALKWGFTAVEEGALPSSSSSRFFSFPCASFLCVTPDELVQLSQQTKSTLLFAGCAFWIVCWEEPTHPRSGEHQSLCRQAARRPQSRATHFGVTNKINSGFLTFTIKNRQ